MNIITHMKNKGGNQTKKRGRKNTQRKTYSLDDLIKGPGEEYAYVQDKFGDARFRVICNDKVCRLGIVRGKIRNSCRMEKGSLALVSIREFEDTKCDILYQYLPDDIDKLIKHNFVSESFVKTGKLASSTDQSTYDDIKFTETSILDNDTEKQVNNTDDVWESGDDEDKIVNTESFSNNQTIKQELNLDDDSADEELDIDDI